MNKTEDTMLFGNKPWLKSYTPGVPEKITYENKCLPEFLERSAKQFPNNMALSFMGHTITYRQLNEMAERFAAALGSFGIKKGDSVACILPNVIPCVAAYYGILKIGG